MWKMMMTPFLLNTWGKAFSIVTCCRFFQRNCKYSTGSSHPCEMFNEEFTLLGRSHSECLKVWNRKLLKKCYTVLKKITHGILLLRDRISAGNAFMDIGECDMKIYISGKISVLKRNEIIYLKSISVICFSRLRA